MRKLCQVSRSFFEFNDPLMATFFVGLQEYGCGREIFNNRSGSIAGFRDGGFCIFNNYFFAKGVDEVFGAS